jgi:hypothetical protein
MKTLPDAVDGEREPEHGELAQPPRRHDDEEEPDACERSRPMGWLVRRQRIPQECDPERNEDEQPVVAGTAWPGRPTGRRLRRTAGIPLSPRAPIHNDARTSGWNSEKLSGWTMYTIEQHRDGDEDAGTERDPVGRSSIPGHGPGQRRGDGSDEREGQCRRPWRRRRASQMNGTWTSEARGIQCAFEGIGAPDRPGSCHRPREDPDQVDVEAVARGEVPRDVHVIEGIGIGGVGEVPDEHDRTTRASAYRTNGIRTAGAA